MTMQMQFASANDCPPIVTSPEIQFHRFKCGDHRFHALQSQYHRLRKSVFVDQLKWDLPTINGEEIDQYDNPTAQFIVSERNGFCLGGLRLAPTTTRFWNDATQYSYMIRDAMCGAIGSIPCDIVHDAPVRDDVWEMTRVVSPSDPDHLRDLIAVATAFLRCHGATRFLFLSRPGSGRICRLWGYDVESLGPRVRIGDGQYQVFSVSTVKRSLASQLAA